MRQEVGVHAHSTSSLSKNSTQISLGLQQQSAKAERVGPTTLSDANLSPVLRKQGSSQFSDYAHLGGLTKSPKVLSCYSE